MTALAPVATSVQSRFSTLSALIDGGGAPIAAGAALDLTVPYDCTITGWQVLGDQSGSVVIDLWKSTFAAFPPSGANSITGSEQPHLSSQQATSSSTLAGWTVALAAGDILRVHVASAATVQRVTLTLSLTASAIAAGGGTGPVASVDAASPLVSSGGATPSISMAAAGVTPGSYSNPTVTVDSYGRVTSASNGTPITGAGINVANTFTAPQTAAPTDGTVGVSRGLVVDHASNGTAPANGFGSGVQFNAADSLNQAAGAGQPLAAIDALWVDASDATRAAALRLGTFSSSGTFSEWVRLSNTGQVLVRSTNTAVAAGISAPWASGDTLATVFAGGSNAGNNQTAVKLQSYSATGLFAQTVSGMGAQIQSVQANGLLVKQSNDFGGAGLAADTSQAVFNAVRDGTANGHTYSGAVIRGYDNTNTGSGGSSTGLLLDLGIGSGTRKFGVDQSGTLTTGIINPSTLTGTGTVPLAALSALTTAQLAAGAGIVAGQIASVNPSALTGAGTVPLAGIPAHASTHAQTGSDPVYYNSGDSTASFMENFPGLFATGAGTLATGVTYISTFTADSSASGTPTKMYAVFEVNAAFTGGLSYFAIALCSVGAAGILSAILAQTGDIHATSLTVFAAPNTASASQVITANAGVYAVPLNLDASGATLSTLPTPTRGTRYALMVLAVGNSAGGLRGIAPGATMQHWWISQALGQSGMGTIAGALPLKAKTLTAQSVLPGTSGGNALPAGNAGSGASVLPWIGVAFA